MALFAWRSGSGCCFVGDEHAGGFFAEGCGEFRLLGTIVCLGEHGQRLWNRFQLNGALTVGTLDGANVEIREEVGAENFFLFGKTVAEVDATWKAGYNPWDVYHANPAVRRVLDAIKNNFFNLDQPGLYQPIWDTLLAHGDHYLVLAEFDAYVECQAKISRAFEDKERWARMCILNVANSGKFSTDRTIAEYAQDIWDIHPCPVRLD